MRPGLFVDVYGIFNIPHNTGTASAFTPAAIEAAATHMYNLGLVKGQATAGGKVDLALGAEITRAELVTLVVRAFGKEEMASRPGA